MTRLHQGRVTERRPVTVDRLNTVANAVIDVLRTSFADYPVQDLMAGCIGAGIIFAREVGAVPGDVIGLVRLCFKAPLEAIPLTTPQRPGRSTPPS